MVATSSALVPVSLAFVRSLYFDAVERLKLRLQWLNDNPLYMTTGDYDDDNRPCVYLHTVDLDFFLGILHNNHRIQPDAPCGCKHDHDFLPWGECEHGNSKPRTGRLREWKTVEAGVQDALAEVESIRTINDVRSCLIEGYDPSGYVTVVYVETAEERDEREREERRIKLEKAASTFASKHRVSVNSLDFIKAIDEEIRRVERRREDWNNPERRMEEWAAHMYAGSRDAYFDDLNFENGRLAAASDHLYDIMEWLGEACPLLMAQYHEQQLKDKQTAE